MKPHVLTLLLGLTLLCGARAAIIVPGADGSDGALNITVNTEIDLSQAVMGDGVTVKWDTDNTANAGLGIYDPKQWVVVFKYSSVTIAAGATVTFKNHPSRAPVVWLVSGDVIIEGAILLNGNAAISRGVAKNAEPGPGGFRGGFPYHAPGASAGAGLGPGGGRTPGSSGFAGYPGSYLGNPSIVPLIGGCGGAGTNSTHNYNGGGKHGGGAGGGALLIACSNTISHYGRIEANGGNGTTDNISYTSGCGSGGALRLVAETISGTGTFKALTGTTGAAGTVGQIRIERVTTSGDLQIVPDPSILNLTSGDTAIIVPPSGAPEAKIISVDSETIPTDPQAEFGAIGADVQVPHTSSVIVTIETTNVEQESQVKVRLAPRMTHQTTTVDAAVSEVISTNPLVIHWTAEVPVNAGYSEISVRVVRP